VRLLAICWTSIDQVCASVIRRVDNRAFQAHDDALNLIVGDGHDEPIQDALPPDNRISIKTHRASVTALIIIPKTLGQTSDPVRGDIEPCGPPEACGSISSAGIAKGNDARRAKPEHVISDRIVSPKDLAPLPFSRRIPLRSGQTMNSQPSLLIRFA
jgi:hypothetical protein